MLVLEHLEPGEKDQKDKFISSPVNRYLAEGVGEGIPGRAPLGEHERQGFWWEGPCEEAGQSDRSHSGG